MESPGSPGRCPLVLTTRKPIPRQHAEEKERNSLLPLVSSLPQARGKTPRPLHILVLSDCIWFVFTNNRPETEALPLMDGFSFYVQVGNSGRDFFSLRVSLLIGTQVISTLLQN